MPQRHGVAEPGPFGDLVHALLGVLEQPLGEQDPLPGQPAQRGGAGLLHEPAGEGARRHVCQCGQFGDRHRLVEMLFQPAGQLRQGAGRLGRQRPVHELRLAAVPVRRHDHPAGDPVGHLRALLLAHHVQAGVDARRAARAGDDRAGVHVEHVRVHRGRRAVSGQVRRVHPVGGAPPAVQQPGRGQHERAGAHAEYPRSPRLRGTQRAQQRRGKLAWHALAQLRVDRAHDHQVRRVQSFDAIRIRQGEPVFRAQRAVFPGDHREVVARQAVVRAVHAENLADHPELERGEPVEHNESHVLEHVAIIPRDWQNVICIWHYCHFRPARRPARLAV
jgi:hypothetical protein